MNPHSYRLKGRDFVHQGKIEIDVNERAVFLSELKAAFSFTPTPIVSLTVYWEVAENEKSRFTEENSNGTVPTDYIYSDFNISNNIICDIHSQENKKALADIVFGRTSSAAYIHRTDDLL